MYVLAALIAAVAALPHPLANSTTPSTCSQLTNGKLLCNGPYEYGLCNANNNVQNIVWGAVAAGTECQCASPGSCTIVASSGGSSPGSVPPPSSSSQPISSQPSATAYAPSASSSPVPTGTPIQPNGTFTMYYGDGSIRDGWPGINEWLSFDKLWNGYENVTGLNCMTAFGVPNNTPQQSEELKQALLNISSQAGVPPSFSLAIMMQESLGCVFVQTTNNGVVNPGLFQSHNGNGTCWKQTSCPASEIQQMVHDGLFGTASGAGLKQLSLQANSTGAERWYRTARLYNSGNSTTDFANLDNGAGSTNCYVVDVANRLVGDFFSGDGLCTS